MKPKSKELTMKYIQNLIITLTLSASFSSAYGQCASGSFNCNDTIQVSVDEMCEAIISADFILEKPELCMERIYQLKIDFGLVFLPCGLWQQSRRIH